VVADEGDEVKGT
jgi:hypothetical protein